MSWPHGVITPREIRKRLSDCLIASSMPARWVMVVGAICRPAWQIDRDSRKIVMITHRIRVGMTKSIRAYGGCLGVERR